MKEPEAFLSDSGRRPPSDFTMPMYLPGCAENTVDTSIIIGVCYIHDLQRPTSDGVQMLTNMVVHVAARHENGYGRHYRFSMSLRVRATALSMS